MSAPTFFPEGSTPKLRDSRWRILQKILGALNDGAGGGSQNKEIYPAGTAAPNDTSSPALRYTAVPPCTMEQWDPSTQQWF